MVMKRPVAIVTDSAAALPRDMAEGLGISIASMEVTIGGNTYVDGPGGALSDFYDRLRTAEKLPTTSAPKPAAWLDVYRRASKQAESVFCVTISATLSASYDAARVACELASQDRPPIAVRLFDSKTAAGSQALIALEAARCARAGEGLDAISAAAGTVAGKVRLVAFLDTLEYVWRGGRVPRVAVWASQLLNIKPVMEYSAGRIGVVARPRSRKAALARLVAEARRDLAGGKAHVNVMHAGAEDEARALLEKIGAEFDCAELFLTQFHPFMGAHTGPGLVGVAYWAE
jgi:DegV family protein with EDD domain